MPGDFASFAKDIRSTRTISHTRSGPEVCHA